MTDRSADKYRPTFLGRFSCHMINFCPPIFCLHKTEWSIHQTMKPC